jgi:vancomycin resistance protein YoaR
MAAQVDPVSATLQRDGGDYVVTPSSTGLSVDVAGAVADAVAAVNNTSPADTSVSVHTSVVPPAVTTEQVQAAVDLYEHVVSSGMTIHGAELSTEITPDMLRGWVHLDEAPTGDSWQLVIEREPVRQFVANYALQTDIPATNATFGFRGGDVEVVPSEDGRAADVEATTNSVMTALNQRADGSSNPTDATLALVTVPPSFATDEARAIASSVTKIGEWTTHFTPSPLNGEGVNISIPTSIIDGYVVEPGQKFDFLNVIGPITSPPYTAGAAIIHGRTVEDGALGGGMCSCSTTLFNAAMRAGLDMRARRNHSYYITRYPVGLDATVWIASPKSRQTMAFVNDLQYPVLIKGINRHGEVTFELYGVPDGRTVELSDPVIENEEKAKEYYIYSDELAPGRKHLIEYTVDGFDSTVVRIVRDRAGNIIHQDTFESHYKTVNGLVEVGRYPGDPPAGKRVLKSVWKATHSGSGG